MTIQSFVHTWHPRAAGTGLLAVYLLLAACDGPHFNITAPDTIVGSGRVSSESRPVHGWSGVALSGVGRLVVDRTGSESLTITAEDNILPLLASQVVGSFLELRLNTSRGVSATREILFQATARELDGVRISGAGEIEASGIDSSFFTVDLSGAGEIRAFGRAERQEISISGAGIYDAEGVASRVAAVTASGAGLARIRVSDRLDANVTGAAKIEYWGDPEVHLTGSGTVVRIGP